MKTRRTIKGTSAGGVVEEAYTPSNPPSYPVTSVSGKTGAVILSRGDVGLGNVDNTSDTNKPVSTAQAAAIAEAKEAGTNAQNAIDTHSGNTSNPHNVTAAQVGAYVKPVSGIPETDLSAEVQEKLNSSGGGGGTTAENLLQSSVTANRQAGVAKGDMVNLGYALGLEEGKMYTVKYKFNGADIVATAKYEAPLEGTLTGATLALCQSVSAEGEVMAVPMLLGVQDYNASEEDSQTAMVNYGFLNIVDKHQITDDKTYTADENNCSVYLRALQSENAQNAVSVEITAIEPFTEVVADKIKNSLKIKVNGTAYSYDGSVETEINIETGGGGGGGEVPTENLLQSPVSANRQANVTEGDMVNLGYALGLEGGKQYTVKYKFNDADVVATAKYEAPTGLPMEGGELCLCQSMSYEGQTMTFPMLLGVSPYAASLEDCQNAMQNYGMLFIVDKHQITGDTTYTADENNSSVYPRALQRSQAGNAVSVEITSIEPFTEVAEVVADRVKNALTIGNVVFDGSAAKSVDLSEYAKTTGTYSDMSVGNADKLGNKAASEYALASDIPDASNFAEKTGTYLDMTAGNAEKLGNKAASEYALAADLTAHETNISNPHSVSKEQVGLENVANERQYSSQNPPPYPVTSVAGQTGAVTLTKSDVGLGNVDNTSDENKPVSTAQATAIADAKKAGTDAQSNVDKIINGTTAVGNAEKLNGKAASEYALASDIPDVSNFAEKTGTYSEMSVGNATNATNIIPDENHAVNPKGRGSGTVGANSTALGFGASAARGSTSLGYYASASGGGSVALGSSTSTDGANSTAVGNYASASRDNSAALGRSATASGNNSTALGYNTSAKGADSVALGSSASAGGSYSTALGRGATTSGSDSNVVQLGNNLLSALRCRVNLTVTSDERDKTDINNITKALPFLEKLNPVTFVSNDRVNYISEEDKKSEKFRKYGMCDYDRVAHAAGTKKGERRRCGLLAQEVVAAMQEVYGTDNYANIVNDNFHDLTEKPSDVENKYTLAYANLVPFLIGAIKELNAKIKILEDKNNV